MVPSDTKRRLILSRWEDARDEEHDHADELAAVQDQLDEVLVVLDHVKYWMQDVLVLHKPMTDPRKILTMLERAI